jgi:hypothetical protein
MDMRIPVTIKYIQSFLHAWKVIVLSKAMTGALKRVYNLLSMEIGIVGI